jgi:hypothetical protein
MCTFKFNANKMLLPIFALLTFSATLPSWAGSEVQLSDGQAVYVSGYSNVYAGPKKIPFQLAAMLSIRNTDPKYSIQVWVVDYYDDNGRIIEHYIEEPFELKPMASTYFYVKEYDKRGGPGANFIVKWRSEHSVNIPIIEGIMLGLSSGQGLSFICPGQVIETHGIDP